MPGGEAPPGSGLSALAAGVHPPDHVAIVHGSGRITFGELARRIAERGAMFAESGVRPGERVLIRPGRSPDDVISMLATLWLGATFVPLDPTWPLARLGRVREVVGARFETMDEGGLRRIEPTGRCVPTAGIGYIMFTSGSTGEPKGVGVPISAFENLITTSGDWYPIDRGARSAALHAFSFDFSVWEVFVPLARGATIVLLDDDARSDPVKLAAQCDKHAITTLSVTSTEARSLLMEVGPALPPTVERVVLGGEATSLGLCRTLNRMGVDVWNLYGPTEATVWCTYHRFSPSDREPVIGRPLPNAEVYVLKGSLEPVPPNDPGEIYIGGRGLASGYVTSPALTAATFVPNPFSPNPGSRMYRTGDVGRVDESGDLVCLGRLDDQVKVRGFRVELGEVETTLESCPGVVTAAVALDGDAINAYVVCDGSVAKAAIRAHLGNHLPPYCIPRSLARVEKLPETGNGKLDRGQLRLVPTIPFAADERSPTGSVATGSVATGSAHELVTAAWHATLQVDHPGRDDDFFAVGGDSLLAASLVGRIREALQREVTVSDVFECRTLDRLCRRVDGLPHTLSDDGLFAVASKGIDEGGFTATPVQSFFLTLQRTLPPGALNVVAAWQVDGLLAADDVLQALESLQTEHPLLGMVSSRRLRDWSFEEGGGPVAFEVIHIASDRRLDEGLRTFAREPVGPSGLLWRAALILGPTQCVLVIVGHHALFDRVSVAILRRSMARALRRITIGDTSFPPRPLISFAHYSTWREDWGSSDAEAESLAFWNRMLTGEVNPSDWPHRSTADEASEDSTHDLRIDLPPAFDAALRGACSTFGATPFMVALAALAQVIGTATGGGRALVATQMANRAVAGSEPVLGCFTTTVLLNIPTSSSSFRSLVEACRTTMLGALEHQEVAMHTVLSLPELRHLRQVPRTALLQHFVVDDPNDELAGVPATFLDGEALAGVQPVELQLILVERQDAWSLRALAQAALFAKDDVERALKALKISLLSGVGMTGG